jgi:hypothetical protein
MNGEKHEDIRLRESMGKSTGNIHFSQQRSAPYVFSVVSFKISFTNWSLITPSTGHYVRVLTRLDPFSSPVLACRKSISETGASFHCSLRVVDCHDLKQTMLALDKVSFPQCNRDVFCLILSVYMDISTPGFVSSAPVLNQGTLSLLQLMTLVLTMPKRKPQQDDTTADRSRRSAAPSPELVQNDISTITTGSWIIVPRRSVDSTISEHESDSEAVPERRSRPEQGRGSEGSDVYASGRVVFAGEMVSHRELLARVGCVRGGGEDTVEREGREGRSYAEGEGGGESKSENEAGEGAKAENDE